MGNKQLRRSSSSGGGDRAELSPSSNHNSSRSIRSSSVGSNNREDEDEDIALLSSRCAETLFQNLFCGNRESWAELLQLADDKRLPLAQAIVAVAYCWDDIPIIEKDETISDKYGNMCLTWLKKAVKTMNCRYSQFFLGLFYEFKIMVPQDLDKAFKLYRLSAEQTYRSAQCMLGHYYWREWGHCPTTPGSAEERRVVTVWLELASEQFCCHAEFLSGLYHGELSFFFAAAENGHVAAMIRLGDYYFMGSEQRLAQDWQTAAHYYSRAARLGDPEAKISLETIKILSKPTPIGPRDATCNGIPDVLRQEMLSEEAKSAFLAQLCISWADITHERLEDIVNDVTTLANEGDKTAQCQLGYLYTAGIGVSCSYAEGFKWFQLSADQGCPDAQYNIGKYYELGLHRTKDKSQALLWYDLALQENHCGAIFQLGCWYLKGIAVRMDAKLALKYISLAAYRGHSGAQFTLAEEYTKGTMFGEEALKAIKWYRVAAAHGHAEAWLRLGVHYMRNNDYIESAVCFQKGNEMGSETCMFQLADCEEHGLGVAKCYEEPHLVMAAAPLVANDIPPDMHEFWEDRG
jgi:TPR repeat protein